MRYMATSRSETDIILLTQLFKNLIKTMAAMIAAIPISRLFINDF